jgi:hypothetical protein
VFRFNPPPGTKVTESGSTTTPSNQTPSRHTNGQQPKVVGTGWTSVVVASVPTDAVSGAGSATKMLTRLPSVSGSWGSGHLLRGTLFSALLTDDGRVAVGAVPPSELYAALAG